MKTYGGGGEYVYVFSTLGLDGGKWSASCTGQFTWEITSGAHWRGDWVGPTVSLMPGRREKLHVLAKN